MKKLLILLSLITSVSAASAQTFCDSIKIIHVGYEPFVDTLLQVIVEAQSINIGHPRFNIISRRGDTLATSYLLPYGLAHRRAHGIPMDMRSAIRGLEKFDGLLTMTAYSGTGDEFCFWEKEFDLCPDSCRTVYARLGNFGNAVAQGTIKWKIVTATDEAVASGSWNVDANKQEDLDTTCLNPGYYRLKVEGVLDGGGQWSVSLITDGVEYDHPWANLSHDTSVSIPFHFYSQCSLPLGVGLQENEKDEINVYAAAGNIHIRNMAGNAIGQVAIYTIDGRLLYTATATGAVADVDISHAAAALYIVHIANASGQVYRKIPVGVDH